MQGRWRAGRVEEPQATDELEPERNQLTEQQLRIKSAHFQHRVMRSTGSVRIVDSIDKDIG